MQLSASTLLQTNGKIFAGVDQEPEFQKNRKVKTTVECATQENKIMAKKALPIFKHIGAHPP